MAKSRKLPSAKPTSAVIRAGIKTTNDTNFVRHARLLSRAAYTWSETNLLERIISVPENQIDALKFHLRPHELCGFTCLPRPSGGSFGDDQEFNEKFLIENPGQIAISDADFGFCIENPRASFKLNPQQFGAEFEDASKLARFNHVVLWGFCYRQTQGPFIGRQGMHSSVGTSLDGFIRSGGDYSLNAFFIRNLIVCDREAKGTWGGCPLLEELYRCLSEYQYNHCSLGRYYGTRVRFPDSRTNSDYHLLPDWRAGKQIIERDFPINLVNQFQDVLTRKHKKIDQRSESD